MNLAEAIALQARHRPHRTAIIQDERLVSFGELQRIVRVGGVKINLSQVDRALLSYPEVTKAAGFVVQPPRGVALLVAALRRELAQRVRIAPARPAPDAA